MEFSVLSEEQRAKLKACTSSEEIIALAQEEGIELTEEQLDVIAGGGIWSDDAPIVTCPACGKSFENTEHLVSFNCPYCDAYLVPKMGW